MSSEEIIFVKELSKVDKKYKQTRLPFAPLSLKQSEDGKTGEKIKGAEKKRKISAGVEIVDKVRDEQENFTADVKENEEIIAKDNLELDEKTKIKVPPAKKFKSDTVNIVEEKAFMSDIVLDNDNVKEMEAECISEKSNNDSVEKMNDALEDIEVVEGNESKLIGESEDESDSEQSPATDNVKTFKTRLSNNFVKNVLLNMKKSMEEGIPDDESVDTENFEKNNEVECPDSSSSAKSNSPSENDTQSGNISHSKISFDAQKSTEKIGKNSNMVLQNEQNSSNMVKIKSGPLENFFTKVNKPDIAIQEIKTKLMTNKKSESEESVVVSTKEKQKLSTEVMTPQGSPKATVWIDDGRVEMKDVDRESEEKTPKSNRRQSDILTPESISRTPNSSKKVKKLTPRQLEKQAEKEMRMKQRLEKAEAAKQLKIEKERLMAEKKSQNERLKKEREEQKEKERQEKEKLKEQQKLEREKKKQEAEAKKEVEKKAKELAKLEELRKKEEEKKKKEDEKRQLEEEEQKKKMKAAQVFTSFFVKKTNSDREISFNVVDSHFTQFQLKKNMRIAPIARRYLEKSEMEFLEHNFLNQDCVMDFIQQIRKGTHHPLKTGKTWPYEARNNDDVMIIEDDEDLPDDDEDKVILEKHMKNVQRAKLLQFHENQRPAYWGTWSKSSTIVTARKPFSQDKHYFDYDYDSDEDWEEEEQGESLSDVEGEKEEEDDYEVDNDFFVPHGYLSDEEANDEEMECFNPETAKAKLKLKEQEFEAECKKKTQEIKPRLFGCFWIKNKKDDHNLAYNQLFKILSPYSAVRMMNNNLPIKTCFSEKGEALSEQSLKNGSSKNLQNTVNKNFPEEALPDLIRLVHGNINNKNFLANEFVEYWKSKQDSSAPTSGTESKVNFSKKKVLEKIKLIAEFKKKEDSDSKKKFWLVKKEYLSNDMALPNSWKYILDQPNSSVPKPEVEAVPIKETSTPKGKHLITKFTKVMTPEERKDQMGKNVNSAIKNVDSPGNCSTVKSGIQKFAKVLRPEDRKQKLVSANKVLNDAKINSPAIREQPKKSPLKKRVALTTVSKKSESLTISALFKNKLENDKVEKCNKQDIATITID